MKNKKFILIIFFLYFQICLNQIELIHPNFHWFSGTVYGCSYKMPVVLDFQCFVVGWANQFQILSDRVRESKLDKRREQVWCWKHWTSLSDWCCRLPQLKYCRKRGQFWYKNTFQINIFTRFITTQIKNEYFSSYLLILDL